jgi:hypothetical protein
VKKRKIYALISAIVFVLLFAVLFLRVNNIIRYKANENDTIYSFYKQPKDSLDVLFVGSSRMFCAVSPMTIWQEEGIASYNMGTYSQSIACSYYLVKEGIRTQHPKVIILDTYGVKYDKGHGSVARVHMVTDAMPLNSTKIEMYRDFIQPLFSKNEAMEIYLPILRYHERWKSLKEEDFHPIRAYMRGFRFAYESESVEEPALTEDTAEVPEIYVEYLNKIIQLCKENQVQLVLCQMPMGDYELYKEIRGRSNTLMKQAEEAGVEVLDFEQLREELNLNYEEDFHNAIHLNTRGAEKISAYFAGYLKENWDLPDHRGETVYKNWEKDELEYQAYKEEQLNAD